MVVYTWFSHFCGFCAFLALLVTFEIQEKLAWKIQKYVLPSVKDLKDWPCLSLWMGEALEDPRQSRNETMTIRKYISIFENFGNVSEIFRNEIYLPNISKTPMLQKISKFWVIFWLSFWAKKKTPMALQWVWNRGKRAWRGLVRGGVDLPRGSMPLFHMTIFTKKHWFLGAICFHLWLTSCVCRAKWDTRSHAARCNIQFPALICAFRGVLRNPIDCWSWFCHQGNAIKTQKSNPKIKKWPKLVVEVLKSWVDCFYHGAPELRTSSLITWGPHRKPPFLIRKLCPQGRFGLTPEPAFWVTAARPNRHSGHGCWSPCLGLHVHVDYLIKF